MSSYDSRYDSYETRPSRRHDFSTKPHDYLSPNTTRSDKPDRSEHSARSTSRRRHHDSRQRSPPSGRSSDDQRARLSRRPRHTWPPAPTVESEARSLARELGGYRTLRNMTRSEIPSRGTIDQDPVIEQVAEYANLTERRFVVVSDSDASSKIGGKGMLTPPTSEDERLSKSRRRPSRINTEFRDVPVDMLRQNTSSTTTSRQSSGTNDSFLSPNVMPGLQQRRNTNDTYTTSSPRVSPARRTTKESFDKDLAIDDDDDPARQVLKGSGARRAATLSASSKDNRRSTESAASVPAPRGLDKACRPSPLVVSSALAAASRVTHDASISRSASLNAPTLQHESSLGSRTASPVSVYSQRSASPASRSPRASQDLSQEHNSSPDSRRPSTTSSRAASRNSSPPPFASIAMPRMPAMPSTDLDWNHLLAANASRRGANPPTTKQPSRLSTSMRADSLPVVPRAMSGSSQSRTATLPYPVEEGHATPDVYMPIEQDHQWLPPNNAAQPSAHQASNIVSSPVMIPAAHMDVRPSHPTRHSFTNTSPTETRAPALRQEAMARTPYVNAVGPTKQEAEAMLKRGLPNCSRPDPVANRDDWYTMVGAPTLDFCPKCIEAIFERTVYRKYFRRALPRDLSTRIACSFGSPWIRLAYLLTVQQRQPNLQLFKDLADIDISGDPCPRGRVAVRSWYGLRDNNGLFVRDFQVCYADVRKLERLLPTFSGFFQRLPNRASYQAHRCSLRAETNRFSQYLNTIIELHDQAHSTRSLPDPMPFVALVEHKLSLKECERDALLLDGLWHYIPALPVFTVCEECFEEVVEPELRKGSELAKHFNRAVQPAYGETLGTSCQLYSPRMRRVFARSVRDNDYKYLARKAKERREAEVRLQEKHSNIVHRLERYDSQGRGNSSDDEESRRRLARELRNITADWKEDWE